MNGVYIRKLTDEDFTQRSVPFLERDLPAEVKRPLSVDYVRKVMPLIKERVKLLSEVAQFTRYFFVGELDYDTSLLLGKDMNQESTTRALGMAQERLTRLEPWNEESLEALLRPLAVEMGLKTGQLFGALRTAVTGETATPPLFQTMAVLGQERCLKRIEAAQDKLRRM
jgi:glutamyl-tRNA synthetase